MMETVIVIGAGLAGSEACLAAGPAGHPRGAAGDEAPASATPAHHSAGFAELVCSNSLRANQRGERRRPAEGGAAPL